MPLKRKSKTSTEFSMSSLTDIIFLLLIFFMLTSNLVAPNALNLKLPGKSKSLSTSKDDMPDIAVDQNGQFFIGGRKVDPQGLERELASLQRRKGKGFSILLSPDKKAPVEQVVIVMDLALQYDANAILASGD
ncbi:MAG: biopolymer transporter ExbD [Saprospiraceae bacterium]|nr:biopolymer transporter ExbD [Saprospiraceae bacterium]